MSFVFVKKSIRGKTGQTSSDQGQPRWQGPFSVNIVTLLHRHELLYNVSNISYANHTLFPMNATGLVGGMVSFSPVSGHTSLGVDKTTY